MKSPMFYQKIFLISCCDYAILTCLICIGWRDTNRNNLICALSPNVNKTSKDGIIARWNHEHFYQKHCWFHAAILPSLLVLSAFGDMTQIETIFLCVLSPNVNKTSKDGIFAIWNHECFTKNAVDFMLRFCHPYLSYLHLVTWHK